jgi:hypothetical protein
MRKHIQETVFRAEYDRGAKNGGTDAASLCHADLLFPLCFGAQIGAGRIVSDFKCGHMQQSAQSRFATGIDDFAWEFGMYAREIACACFVQNSYETNNGVTILDGPLQRDWMVQISVKDIHCRQHDQGFCSLAPTRRHAHAKAARCKLAHHVATEKAGAADDANRTDFHVSNPDRELAKL